MNDTDINATALTSNVTAVADPWAESGAMLYVAMSVAIFSAVIMCCTWFLTHGRDKNARYGTIREEDVELNTLRESDSEEDIALEGKQTQTLMDAARAVAGSVQDILEKGVRPVYAESPEFVLDDSDEEVGEEQEV